MLAKEIAKLLENEAAYHSIIELNVGGKQNVIIKALQRHPAKGHVMHADFVRVVAGQKLTAIVPVHFVGEAAPVKKGGEISHVVAEIEVSCLPKDLPEFIEVDRLTPKSAPSFTCRTSKLLKALSSLLWHTVMTKLLPTFTLHVLLQKQKRSCSGVHRDWNVARKRAERGVYSW
jgi:ribosomal protein bL25 (Ctc-form)